MEPGIYRHSWYALQTRLRYEQFAAVHLRSKGYEPFLPVYLCRRRWADRIKNVELPLFPGYLFCRFDVLNRLPILVTPGIIQVIGNGKTPIPIEDAEIAAIQAAVQSGLPRQPWGFVQLGETVRIACGPLVGHEGILLNLKGSHRLVLSVSLLRRSVAVEIDSAWVSPVSSQSRSRLRRAGFRSNALGVVNNEPPDHRRPCRSRFSEPGRALQSR